MSVDTLAGMGTTPTSTTKQLTVPVDGSRMAAFWLFTLVLAITISPRLRLEGGGGVQAVDLRLQDLLVVPIVLFLFAGRQQIAPLFRLWGWLLPTFFWLVSISFLVLVFSGDGDVSPLRRLLFAGRGIEIFVIAALVAHLYSRAGSRALRFTLLAFHAAAIANFSWTMFQLATGSNSTLLGGTLGDSIQSYGPKLIGEPSSFGTGQFYAFIAALGVAQLRARHGSKTMSVALIGIGAVGAVAAESRASILAIAFAVMLLFTVSRERRSFLNPIGATFALLGALVFALTAIPRLAGRLSLTAVSESLLFRASEIWKPQLQAIADNPLQGVGPGGLVPPLAIEGHNVFMRAVLDYGLVIGGIFLALFWIVVRRSWKDTRRVDVSDADFHLFANLAFVFTVSLFVAGLSQDSLTAVTSSNLAMVAIGLFAAVHARVVPKPEPAVEAPQELAHAGAAGSLGRITWFTDDFTTSTTQGDPCPDTPSGRPPSTKRPPSTPSAASSLPS